MVAASSNFNAYFAEIIALLWPDEGRTRPSGGSQNSDLSLIALPNRHRPKLLLPSHPPKVAAAALRNYKASATGRQVIVTKSLAAVARTGILRAFPNHLRVATSNQSIDNEISRLLGTKIHIAVYIGPDRAVQKPILQVIDASGSTVAFAKLSTRGMTRALIRHEAESLSILQSLVLQELGTPRVLGHMSWHGSELIVQSAVQPGHSRMRLREKLPTATMELMGCLGIAQQSWMSGHYRNSLLQRLVCIDKNPQAKPLKHLLAGLDARLARETIRLGAWHGDWAPWNMTTSDTRLIAWDWEHFQPGVALGLDAAHFDLSELTVNQGKAMVETFRLLLHGQVHGLVADLSNLPPRDVLFSLYLLEISLRYLEAGEDQVAGTKMSQMSTWLPDVVRLCLESLQRDAP